MCGAYPDHASVRFSKGGPLDLLQLAAKHSPDPSTDWVGVLSCNERPEPPEPGQPRGGSQGPLVSKPHLTWEYWGDLGLTSTVAR